MLSSSTPTILWFSSPKALKPKINYLITFWCLRKLFHLSSQEFIFRRPHRKRNLSRWLLADWLPALPLAVVFLCNMFSQKHLIKLFSCCWNIFYNVKINIFIIVSFCLLTWAEGNPILVLHLSGEEEEKRIQGYNISNTIYHVQSFPNYNKSWLSTAHIRCKRTIFLCYLSWFSKDLRESYSKDTVFKIPSLRPNERDNRTGMLNGESSVWFWQQNKDSVNKDEVHSNK